MMKVHVTRNIVFVLLGCCALVAMATPLKSADQPERAAASQATTISEKELSAFVEAYVAYQNIRASYGPALERAKDAQQKKRIEQEANTKVKQSLDAQGLTSERYNHIFATVNGNEELRKKVLKKVEDERRKS
jgi:ribosomal protein S19E (S16A)